MLAKQHHSSHFPSPSCFRPSSSAGGGGGGNRSSKVAPPFPAAPTLATSLYHTELGVFAVTWSRSMLGRYIVVHKRKITKEEEQIKEEEKREIFRETQERHRVLPQIQRKFQESYSKLKIPNSTIIKGDKSHKKNHLLQNRKEDQRRIGNREQREGDRE
ncbi:hypothetical protein DM860_007571 [Cuscuta australis]|uniref:Uncharacterized protein n=1 Tax=Cuscuta australis TaxID=267555 RepID=A0A328E8H9_9ASTE|nr:hypothetical protein DM860_007571 [Cuscuta australis]